MEMNQKLFDDCTQQYKAERQKWVMHTELEIFKTFIKSTVVGFKNLFCKGSVV